MGCSELFVKETSERMTAVWTLVSTYRQLDEE